MLGHELILLSSAGEVVPERRQLAAIVFTDLVGYTALAQKNEALAMQLLEEHRRLVRPFFPKHNGREIKTIGDAFLVEFASALEATRCAFEIQQSLNEFNSSRPQDRSVMLRIGIHLGDVIHDQNDVYGDAVNIASRIEPLASPGGICVSEQVYDQIKNKFEFPFSTLGERNLKNVSEPVEVFRVILPWEKKSESESSLEKTRIAVLPFANMSPDPSDEYFADGMTEELISTISKISELSVISRTSVMGYKKKDKKAVEIARELNVGTLLEGSVRKAASRVRISVQLIEAESDKHLWAENYDRNLEDIFAVQSEVAEKVASSLQVKLTGEDKKRIETGKTPSPEAYAECLKGRVNMFRMDRSSLMTAIKHFEAALAHDSNYALAYSGLASAWASLGFMEIVNAQKACQKAEEYAQKALKLDESLPEAHLARAEVLMSKYDFAARERELKRAIELNPNLAEPHLRLAANFSFMNRWHDCFHELERALELDPLSTRTLGQAGTLYLYSDQYDKAIEYLNDSMELDPSNSFYLDNLGLAYIQTGNVEEGLGMVKRAFEMSGGSSSYGDLAWAYVKAQKPDEARKLLAKLNPEGNRSVPPMAAASVYAVLGEKQRAIDWLERAYDEHSFYLATIAADFEFENLRDEPRFRALIERIHRKKPT
jgi:adenylate cyclase